MTTYNTGNPIGSTDARDLYDNAQNLDNFVNGAAASYSDRLGVIRRSLAGIEATAEGVLNGIGYAVPVAYASGISMTLTSQTVDYNGVIYAPLSSALPFTTSSWGTDSAKFRAVQVTDAGLITYTPAGTVAVATTVQSKLRSYVSVLDFYANGVSGVAVDPTGTIDSTGGIQAALNYCHTTGKTLYVPAGTYKITSQLTKPQSFDHPNIVGDGYRKTILKGFGFSAGTAILQSTGGSGAFCGAVVSGIQFTSDNGNSTGVEVDGQCGLTFRDCQFGNLKIGLLLHNKSSGNFGEFVVADNCDFESNCVEALVYQRTGGTDSFHGSGLRNCAINEAAGATLPKIRIGGTGSTSNDIIVYNAPLSLQIWKNTTTKVLVNNTTRYSTNFHGHITLELFGAAASSGKWTLCLDTRITYFLGTISSLQDVTQRGTMVLCDTFETNVDGTVNALLKPYRVDPVPMASGANNITTLGGSTTETYLVRVRFADSASQARKVYLLVVNLDSTGVHTVTSLAQLEDYFGGNMPYPAFSMSGQTLVATATFASTVSCTATVSKIGIGEAFSL